MRDVIHAPFRVSNPGDLPVIAPVTDLEEAVNRMTEVVFHLDVAELEGGQTVFYDRRSGIAITNTGGVLSTLGGYPGLAFADTTGVNVGQLRAELTAPPEYFIAMRIYLADTSNMDLFGSAVRTGKRLNCGINSNLQRLDHGGGGDSQGAVTAAIPVGAGWKVMWFDWSNATKKGSIGCNSYSATATGDLTGTHSADTACAIFGAIAAGTGDMNGKGDLVIACNRSLVASASDAWRKKSVIDYLAKPSAGADQISITA